MCRIIFVNCLLLLFLNNVWMEVFAKEGSTEQLYKIGNMTVTTNCRRKCMHGERSKNCYFKFNIENYSAMGLACGSCASGNFQDCFNPQCITGDGLERGVTVVNRQLTGPSIQVCRNDVIIVDVINQMKGLTVTIHWHGILQKGTQYMDGVPGVTQCAILPHTSFRYIFHTPDSGTYFWHSHAGLGRTGGIYGDLIVREPPEGNPHSHLYNQDKYEHVILVSDWNTETPEMYMPGLPTRLPGIIPYSYLVNGKGKAVINAATGERNSVPYKMFKVKFGETYRFRLINAGNYLCPIQIQIFQHNMKVIETDGSDCIAQKCDTLVSYAGERYSFVLTADQPPDLYWIRIRGLSICEILNIPEQFAILAYEEALPVKTVPKQEILPNQPEPAHTDIWPSTITLNPFQCISSESSICITDLKAISADQAILRSKPDLRLNLNFGFHIPNTTEFFSLNRYDNYIAPLNYVGIGHVNSISNVHTASPLLTQPYYETCTVNKLPSECSGEPICFCPHVIKIFPNAIVEIILSDTYANPLVSHPFYLHGYSFYVLDSGSNPTEDSPADIPEVFSFGPKKDTVNVKPGGYAVIRFRADNPGQWFFHCHYEYHMESGMSVVLQVGGPGDYPSVPPGFPKCANFLPAAEPVSNP